MKNLANQTTCATDEITDRIARLQGHSGQAVAAIERIGSIIHRTSDIADVAKQQQAATEAITRNTNTFATDAGRAQTSVVDMAPSSASSYATTITVMW
ncbi:MAG: methyl-accepting chemotaxis sensory transducer [Rhodospirillaceae bacterium]|nr:MAG: methyl-accepting chemotaxis sensory transducer [Rhodospirillaceae bacterium]